MLSALLLQLTRIGMCGIYASLSKTGLTYPSPDLQQCLCNRGPDHLGQVGAQIDSKEEALSFHFMSTVLALRGGHVFGQPLIDPVTRSLLCWNGEAWKIGQELVKGNDGQIILNLLTSCTSEASGSASFKGVIEAIQSISGPFAFVYFDRVHSLLYFGRDRLGRRSLLSNVDSIAASVQLSSVADTARGTWKEVEADGIYVIAPINKSFRGFLDPLSVQHMDGFLFPTYKLAWPSNVSQQVPVSQYSFTQ